MNDRELLERAAKAAGIELKWHDDGTAFANNRAPGYWGVWNPLTDNGDALRLAVKLGLLHTYHMDCVAAMVDFDATDPDPYPYAATRRAIVRAAAALGE